MNLSKFLITTSKSVYLYNNGLKELQSGKGVYFGCCKIPEFGYVVLARNNFDGTGGGNPNGVNTLEFFDNDFKYISSNKIDFIKDGHQIYFKDEIIYVTNTGLNCITTIARNGEIGNIQLYNEVGEDVHHINSINFHNGYWYINQHRKMRGLDNGGVAIFDSNWTFVDYIEIGKHCHNSLVCDKFLFATDSDQGNLVKVDLNTKEIFRYYIAKDMTRGIVIDKGNLLIGISQKDTRENRHKSKLGSILSYNKDEMVLFDVIEIEDCGQVNDLLLV